jgi:hypothetical protein
VMTMDSRWERWWFMGQMLTGVNGYIGYQRQKAVYHDVDDALAGDLTYQSQARRLQSQGRFIEVDTLQRPYVDAILEKKGLALVAPTETAARAYSGVAGMLNLMCMFDVLVLALMGIRGERPVLTAKEPAR